MNWKKIGKIFDPTQHQLFNDCKEFAQSPQTLVFDDFVRVYFSTRKKEPTGKFLSHIAYVDFDKSFQKVLNISKHQVIELGKLGCFDEHGIFPINPLRVDKKVYAYTCGWSRRVSVSVETSTGLAISEDDGKTFKKIGDGPVLTSSLKEPFLVGDSFVKFYNGMFHMWYIFGTGWSVKPDDDQPARVYKIGYATSSDGINWTKEEGKCIIPNVIGDDECQALPSVEFFNGKYHMFFCYRYSTGFRKIPERGYRIGYAHSTDLINWTRNDASTGIKTGEIAEWDSDMMCYPHVFLCDGKLHLLYNGNEFGKNGFGLAVLQS